MDKIDEISSFTKLYGAINDMKICEYGASKLGKGANKSMFIKTNTTKLKEYVQSSSE